MSKSEEKLKTIAPDDTDYISMEAALQRALIRMQVAAKASRK
jgi:F-type H+-transporting ATPase subunit epsilon